MTSSYQPHLIAEFKTGLFNYLEPWIRPNEAFQPLINAFTQRGSLIRRNGYTFLGRMSYEDQIAVGNGGASYSGTLLVFPITAGSLVITVTTSAGPETFNDNGVGVLTGTLGDSGTINYTTGAWTITLIGGRTIAAGVNFFATYSPGPGRPIMGLKTWTNEINDSQLLVALDTDRASVFNVTSNSFDPIAAVDQQIWLGDGTTTTPAPIFTNWIAVAPSTNIFVPRTVTLTDGTTTVTDNGAGTFPAAGNFGAGNTVNYSTGVIQLNFVAAPSATTEIIMTADLEGDYFTGNNTNFFNSQNWLGFLFLTNNKDPITLYNGQNNTLSRPPFSITAADQAAFVNDILACLDIDVYKNRLIVQRPTVRNTPVNFIAGQGFYWSAIVAQFGGNFGGQASPTNLVADVVGNGGFLNAPTDDFIQSSEFLRDYLLVQFKASTWTFRFTNNNFDPFRWDKINATKSTNAPYATVAYDERVTSAGAQGFIACDGVNVQRYDIGIIDQWLDIDQKFFGQCFAQRFDTINQTWMLYPSVGSGMIGSDSALIYNFLENSWAIYSWILENPANPFSCLGLYATTKDATWVSFAPAIPANTWEEQDVPWNSYLDQDLSPDIIGGDAIGGIWIMDDGVLDGDAIFTTEITSTQWNPYFPTGQRADFGYIDIYYEKSPGVDPIAPFVELTLTFTVNNNSSTAQTRVITLDGQENQDKNWKRVFIQLNGEFMNMTISDNGAGFWKIYGMILWASPAGRLTPGATV